MTASLRANHVGVIRRAIMSTCGPNARLAGTRRRSPTTLTTTTAMTPRAASRAPASSEKISHSVATHAVDGLDASASNPSTAHVIPGEPAYPGLYCDWSVTPTDVAEVWAYRVCLSIVAIAVLACSSVVFVPDAPVNLNAAYFTGATSLGVALVLIHMYVDPIKKAMQAMWIAGFVGSVGIAATHGDSSVPVFVASHPWSVWLVGPMFAALTGVAFKEGMCYGKAECAGLFFVVPAMLLGHLTGLGSEGFEKGSIVVWCALIAMFAARKYTQEVKDDIGDKSVFIFNSLSEDEKLAWTMRARERDPSRFARMMDEE